MEARTTKYCKHCHAIKPLLDFGIDRQKKNGRTSWCGPCVILRNKSYYSTKKEAKQQPTIEEAVQVLDDRVRPAKKKQYKMT